MAEVPRKGVSKPCRSGDPEIAPSYGGCAQAAVAAVGRGLTGAEAARQRVAQLGTWLGKAAAGGPGRVAWVALTSDIPRAAVKSGSRECRAGSRNPRSGSAKLVAAAPKPRFCAP